MGTYKIDLAQPLANLAFYCLEPQVGDGLAGWGFFNEALESLAGTGSDLAFPVVKYYEILKKNR